MATVSIETAIIFIASIVVAASVAGVLTTEVGRLSQAIDEQGVDVSQQVRTDIEIISDAGSSNCCYDDAEGNITVLVKNTGSRTLPADPDQVEAIVNGTYDPDVSVSVLDGSEWRPGNVAEVVIEASLAPGEDHRVKLVVSGDEEVVEFRT